MDGRWVVTLAFPAGIWCHFSIQKAVFSFRIPRHPKDQVGGSYQESVVNDEIDNRDTNGYKVVLRYMLVSKLTYSSIYIYIHHTSG